MVKSKLESSMKIRPEDFQIEIPEPLIYEVDKIVAETGLYSDKVEFVTDAVRRLIIENKKEEVNTIFHGNDVHNKSKVKIEDVEPKGMQNEPPKV